jgi:hypothetical protein
MKKNLGKALIILAVFLCGTLVGTPLVANAVAATTAWAGSIPAQVTEPIVVKSGATVLANGYTFQAVSMPIGGTNVKTLTVQNTGTTSFIVRPIATSSAPTDVTVGWNNPTGGPIAAGASYDFILTLTAVNVNPSVTVAVSFTRE